jgi:hypothetical protein
VPQEKGDNPYVKAVVGIESTVKVKGDGGEAHVTIILKIENYCQIYALEVYNAAYGNYSTEREESFSDKRAGDNAAV